MEEKFKARLVVESIRNGVPNKEAVIKLGCNQPRADSQFIKMLDQADNVTDPIATSQGMLISGDFGTGKSHLLAHFEHLALSRGFVCSKVSVSKETPLYDLGKVFTAAIEKGRIPGVQGRFVEEIAYLLKPNTDKYTSFFHWAEESVEKGLLSSIFPASLKIHEESQDLQLMNDMESFWSGERILMKTIRDGLKLINQSQYFKIQAPKPADLPSQRLRFITELIKTAGFRGWVILLDEIELIGSYSILQRGRSYSQIARWMGETDNVTLPGLIFVGALTEDFSLEVISPNGKKKDWDYVPAKIEQNPKYGELAPLVRMGMELLEKKNISLEPPSEENIRNTFEILRDLYRMAFDWDPPPVTEVDVGGAGELGRMRYKVRSVINDWDLRRFYEDYIPDPRIEGYKNKYTEDADLVNSNDNGH